MPTSSRHTPCTGRSCSALNELTRLVGADPRRWLLAFDFDGTLSPIVANPEDAVLDPELAPLLECLRELSIPVVLFSGRPLAFLRERAPGLLAVGSYGLELPPAEGSDTISHPEGFDAAAAREALTAAEAALPGVAGAWPGAVVEIKDWGVSIHLRKADPPIPAEAVRAALAPFLSDGRLELVPGRLVWELRPAAGVDKGWAIRELAQRFDPSAVVYAGDDVGDAPAFAAVRELGERMPALAIGVNSGEARPEAFINCDVVLEGRQQLADVLRELVSLAEAAA